MKNIPHYHLTPASKINTTEINGRGTSVLKLYYDVDTANVSYLYSDTIPTKAPTLPTATTRKYGTTITITIAGTPHCLVMVSTVGLQRMPMFHLALSLWKMRMYI